LGAALVALPAIGLLVVDLLPQQEAYANADYGFSLLAALGAEGCIGYLVGYIFSCFDIPVYSCPIFAWLRPEPVVSASVPGERWPLLVALLFGPIMVLLAGLGGWVEAHGRRHATSPCIA